MCNEVTDGIIMGCGHYNKVRLKDVLDCGDRNCIYSRFHSKSCGSNCYATCKQYYGPDRETIVGRERTFCKHCEAWSQKTRARLASSS